MEEIKAFFIKNQVSVLLFTGLFFAVLAGFGFYNTLLAQQTGEGTIVVEEVPIESLQVAPEETSGSLPIVGNKNSKIYHFDFCVGAKNMREENKVYFASVEAARGAGFVPAKNCPGLP